MQIKEIDPCSSFVVWKWPWRVSSSWANKIGWLWSSGSSTTTTTTTSSMVAITNFLLCIMMSNFKKPFLCCNNSTTIRGWLVGLGCVERGWVILYNVIDKIQCYNLLPIMREEEKKVAHCGYLCCMSYYY